MTPTWSNAARLQLERGERPARHDEAGDFGDRLADHLGDEGHRARGPRVDLEHVNLVALQRILHVHQPADVERQREFARIRLELRDGLRRERARGQRTGAVAGVNARLLDMLHDAGDEHRLAVAERVDVDLDRVRQIAVEQQGVRAEHRVDLPGLVVGIARLDVGRHQARQHAEEIIVERRGVVNDRHRAPAEHIGGTNDQRQAEVGRDQPRLLDRIGDRVLRLLEAELVEQALEAVAIFGKIDRVDRSAEDRRAGLLDRARELQRRLAAELHDHALQLSRLALLGEDREHVLGGQRFEIEPVGRVVIRRHRLRIAVDHDRLVAGVPKRERGVAAAIVELDALPDPVRDRRRG